MSEIHDVMSRFLDDLLARPRGPLGFRYVFQPLMAAVLAWRDGVKDARAGRAPYFSSLLHDAVRRGERIGEAFTATGRILAFGLLLDAAYQYIVLHRFYVGEALVVAFTLVFVPYVLLRGPADRAARKWIAHKRREAP
jgi:hypothetical protein